MQFVNVLYKYINMFRKFFDVRKMHGVFRYIYFDVPSIRSDELLCTFPKGTKIRVKSPFCHIRGS